MHNWVDIREDEKEKEKLDLICTFDTIISIRNNKEFTLFKTKNLKTLPDLAEVTTELEFYLFSIQSTRLSLKSVANISLPSVGKINVVI